MSLWPLSHERTQSHDSECITCVSAPTNRTMLLSIEDYFAHADIFKHANPSFLYSCPKENAMSIIDSDRKAFAMEVDSLVGGKGVSPWGAKLPIVECMAAVAWKISEEKMYLIEGSEDL